MKEFKNKVAVITGAASGIGRGLAERCAQEGMKVVLAGINESTLRLAEKEIKSSGATTLVVRTDVSKAGEVEALANKTLDTFGAVHLLFNNAGVAGGSTAWGSTLADWEWTLGVNLWGVIYGIHFFVPIMLKQNTECHIVNTSSAQGLIIGADPSPYSTSKHAVTALSESLYRQLEQIHSNIGVSVLIPGWVKTNIMTTERNRPARLKNNAAEEQLNQMPPAVLAFMQQQVDNGTAPARVADIVFNAIKEKKYYIFPNIPGRALFEGRAQDILQERNPTSLAPRPK
jgi:NAD(P)-dependent dehydrogenase (short-subunit alcohol dehydrogenase family)